MKKIIKTFIYICVIINAVNLFAQNNYQFQDPKTPDVFQFEKYGNIPILKYTGRPSLTIPLWNINYGDISFPLEINYTSNGIRVDEEASRVGLGWYFGTGMISQIKIGKDDLHRNNYSQLKMQVVPPDFYWSPYGSQYITHPNPSWFWEGDTDSPINFPYNDDPNRVWLQPTTPNNILNQYFAAKVGSDGGCGWINTESVYLSRNGQLKDYKYVLNDSYNLEDVSIDIFQANFFGHKVSFYKDPSTHLINTINNEKYEVELISQPAQPGQLYGTNKWIITAPDGIKYYFNEERKTYYESNTSFSTLLSNNTSYSTSAENTPYFDSDSFNTSHVWEITSIEDTKGNSINFNYEDLGYNISSSNNNVKAIFYRGIQYNHWYPLTNYIPYLDVPLRDGFLNPFLSSETTTSSNAIPKFVLTESHSLIAQRKSVLKEINYGTTKVKFNISDREDIPGDKKIDSVEIQTSDLSSPESYYNTKKKIDFSYGYFSNNSTDNTQKRLKLLSVKTDEKPYVFSYNPIELPNKNSNSFDYWGFYNGMPNTSSITNPFRILYSGIGSLPQNIFGWDNKLLPFVEGIANNSAHPDFCKAGILEKVIYPTGGSTEFIYELNEFNNYFFPNFDNKIGLSSTAPYIYTSNYTQNTSKGFGLRVKETIEHANDETFYKKKYSYSGGKHIPAYTYPINMEPYLISSLPDNVGSPPYSTSYTSTMCQGERTISYSNNNYQTSLLGNGNFVGYDCVTIEEENSSSLEHNGKTISYYTNVADVTPIEKYAPNSYGTGYSSSNYALFGESIRATNIENGLLIREDVFDENSNKIKMDEYEYDLILSPTSFKYNVKAIKTPTTHGYIRSNTQSSPNYETYNEYLFFYYPLKNPRNILKNKKTTNYFNTGNIISSIENVYDLNFIPTGKKIKDSNNIIFYEENSTMKNDYFYTNQNILNLPETKTIWKNGNVESVINYSYYSGSSNSTYLYQMDILPKGSNNPQVLKTTHYKYGFESKLIEFKNENQTSTAIIWGYGHQLPIAKIENATYAQVSSFVEDLQIISNTGTEAALITALNALRTSLPNAMVTSYTHKPLVGVSTITDPKGDTITYIYDSFNRLKEVKDKNGNKLSENEYHYRP